MRSKKSRGRPFEKGTQPSNFKDMSGQRFGMLSVLSRAESRSGLAYWLCACDCGNELVVSGGSLRGGQHSCGCVSLGRRTHNMSDTRVYRIWGGMRNRCENPNSPHYTYYGARGITVCERWCRFETFLADMGEPPDGHSIERRSNDGNYEPSNCYWLPQEKQSQNRRGNVYVAVDGEKVCVAEAARRLGIKGDTLRYRMKASQPLAGTKVGGKILLIYDGATLSVSGWARKLGCRSATLSSRRYMGWSVERILGTPV